MLLNFLEFYIPAEPTTECRGKWLLNLRWACVLRSFDDILTLKSRILRHRFNLILLLKSTYGH